MNTDEPQEVSLKQALKALVWDEQMADVHLEGSDGVRVSAIRALLAARSPVFHHMFYGGFEEASANVIRIDFPGRILQCIVQYCMTDEANLLEDETVSVQDLDIINY